MVRGRYTAITPSLFKGIGILRSLAENTRCTLSNRHPTCPQSTDQKRAVVAARKQLIAAVAPKMSELDEEGEPSAMNTLAEICVHVEIAISYVADLTTNTTSDMEEAVGGEGVLLPLVLMVVSLVIAVRGGRCIRPSCVLAAAAVGFWSIWDMAQMFVGMAQQSEDAQGIPCEARLIGATVVALIAAVIAFCVVKVGLFLLGALAGGGMAY